MSSDNYEVSLNVTPETFPYQSSKVQDIVLKRHEELPEGYKYFDAKISYDEKYIGVAARGDSDCRFYLWNKDNLYSKLYHIERNNIELFEFAPNSKSFVLFDQKKGPIHYNIKNGEKIRQFDRDEKMGGKPLCCAFSPKSRFLSVGYPDRFTIWEVIKGKVKKSIKDPNPSKFIRDRYLISIGNDCDVHIYSIKEDKEEYNFTLNKINSPDDILGCILSSDCKSMYYGTKEGIYQYNISNRKTDTIQDFGDEKPSKIFISWDCQQAVSSNMRDINFWNYKIEKLGMILKEDFDFISVNFQTKKIITMDKICINITNYSDDIPEEFIWLNKNPKEFDRFFFSPEFAYLLTIIGEHEAVLYSIDTGRVIKKWYHKIPHWYQSCQMAPETSRTAIVATKSTDNFIKIWNYQTGNEVITLEGFNVYNLCFSSQGNLLGCGGVSGEEIARVWNLEDGLFNSFIKKDTENKNTFVYLTKNESLKLIAVPENQKPLVYEVDNGKLAYKCDNCPVNFYRVFEIKSTKDNSKFFVFGVNMEKEKIAVLFDMENGHVLERYEKCENIDFSDDSRLLISKSNNIEEGKLVITDLTDMNKPKLNCDLDADISRFLQGSRTIVCPFKKDNGVLFMFTDPETGKLIGKLEYNKKKENYCEMELSVDPNKNILILRHILLE